MPLDSNISSVELCEKARPLCAEARELLAELRESIADAQERAAKVLASNAEEDERIFRAFCRGGTRRRRRQSTSST